MKLGFLVAIALFCSLGNVTINAIPTRTPNERKNDLWNTQLVSQQHLFAMINELKRENVKLRHAKSNWRQNIFRAANHIRRLENTVKNLQETNTKWAKKINDMKANMNAMKIEKVKNDMLKKKREDLGLF